MKLTYWVATSKVDNDAYSLIGRTKKQVLDQLAERSDAEDFEEPKKRIVMYSDAFDLFEKVSGEGGGRSSCGYEARPDQGE